MSWWRISRDGEAELYLGDPTADAVGVALDALVQRRVENGQRRPSPAQLASALQLALGPRLDGRSLDTHDDAPPPDDLRAAVATALRGIDGAIRERFEREAAVAEVVAAFEFVIRPEPEVFLDVAPGLDFRLPLSAA